MVAFVIVLVLVALFIEAMSLRGGADRLNYDTWPSRKSVDPDEEFEVVTQLDNPSRFPMSYIRMVETMPSQIKLQTPKKAKGFEYNLGISGNQDVLRSTSTLFLLPRQKLVRRIKATMPNRGRYFFQGATVYVGDFFGTRETVEYYRRAAEIVVLPRRLNDVELCETLGGFLGDISVRRFIMEDPVLTIGYRDYTGREPMKSIAWTQTARKGSLMVKKYDYTLELSVTVILNVEYKSQELQISTIEKCYSAARTVCETLEEKGVKYGFITNATAAGALGLWSQVGDGLGKNHLITILEGLGRATYSPTESFNYTLARTIRGSEQGRSYIIITPAFDEKEYGRQIARLREISGGQVHIMQITADEEAPEEAREEAAD